MSLFKARRGYPAGCSFQILMVHAMKYRENLLVDEHNVRSVDSGSELPVGGIDISKVFLHN